MTRREVSPGLGIPLYLETDQSMRDAKTLITISDGEIEQTILFTKTGSAIVDPNDYVFAPEERRSQEPMAIRRHYAKTLFQGVSWFFVAVLFSFVAVTATGVIHAKVVLTDSMTPSIQPGDIVIEAPLRGRIPEVGQVVTYIGKRIDGSPVAEFTHRVIGGDENTGFIVKGDNNAEPDVQQPKPEDISGIVLFVIPLLGKLLTAKNLINLALAGFGLWLIFDAIRDRR
jgi:signal peptidase I